MGMFFNPDTASFYDERVHGARMIEGPLSLREIKAGKRPQLVPNADCRIPETAVPVADKDYFALMAEVAKGRQIVARGKRPVAVDQHVDDAEQREMRRRDRNRLLLASDWTQLADTLTDDAALKAEWAVYRQELRGLDLDAEDFAWPDAPDNALGGSV